MGRGTEHRLRVPLGGGPLRAAAGAGHQADRSGWSAGGPRRRARAHDGTGRRPDSPGSDRPDPGRGHRAVRHRHEAGDGLRRARAALRTARALGLALAAVAAAAGGRGDRVGRHAHRHRPGSGNGPPGRTAARGAPRRVTGDPRRRRRYSVHPLCLKRRAPDRFACAFLPRKPIFRPRGPPILWHRRCNYLHSVES